MRLDIVGIEMNLGIEKNMSAVDVVGDGYHYAPKQAG